LNFPEENQVPYLPPCETSHKKIKDPQNDKKKIPKQKPFKVHMKKGTYPISSLVKLHTKKFEDPQMIRRKLKILEIQNMKIKNFQSS
jgi:hypothetical protein